MNNFKYIKNISGGEGTILLYDQIGDFVDENGNYTQGISGSAFAYEMQYLQDCCTSISVRINSIGGNVLDGYSIVSAILNSKVPCNTYIDGLAASIAGVIAMAGKKCMMADYGTLMMHNPSGGTGDKAVLDLVKNTLVTILSNRTKMTPEDISAMMDVETWLDAKQCMEMGLIDGIVSCDKKMKMAKTTNLLELATIYNKIINPKNKTMIKVTNKLGLSEDASEDSIVSEIEKKDSTNAELTSELEVLKAKLKAIEDAEEAAKAKALEDMKNKATELVEKAINEKKIEADKKDSMIEMAVVNFALVENMISKINNVKDAVKVFNRANVVEEKTDWTIRDFEKKDPKGLEKIKNENPEKYQEMYNAYYKK